MKQLNLLFATALVALVFACGGADKPTDNPGSTGSAATSDDSAAATSDDSAAGDALYNSCKSVLVKARECTDEYLPALVAARVEVDVPAGIAAADQADGREALVAKAHEEWKRDSTDEAIESGCRNVTAGLPAEHHDKVNATSSECVAKAACGEFVECIMPLHKEMFQVMAAKRAEANAAQ
jgi:hypothetical protein